MNTNNLVATHALIMVSACLGAFMFAAFHVRKRPTVANIAMTLGFIQIPTSAGVFVILAWISSFRPYRFDLYLNRADALFRYPANSFGVLFELVPWLRSVALLDYLYWWAPVWAAMIYIAWKTPEKTWPTFYSVLLSGFLSLPCYLLMPACGPGFVLPKFPAIYTGDIHLVAANFTVAPINCFPSVHFAVAVMVLWMLRESKIGRVLASIHVAMTATATLGLGEHYFVDLLASLPYAWLVISLPELVRVRMPQLVPIPVTARSHSAM